MAPVALWIAQDRRYYDRAAGRDLPDDEQDAHRRIVPGVIDGTQVVALDSDYFTDVHKCVVTGPGEVTP